MSGDWLMYDQKLDLQPKSMATSCIGEIFGEISGVIGVTGSTVSLTLVDDAV